MSVFKNSKLNKVTACVTAVGSLIPLISGDYLSASVFAHEDSEIAEKEQGVKETQDKKENVKNAVQKRIGSSDSRVVLWTVLSTLLLVPLFIKLYSTKNSFAQRTKAVGKKIEERGKEEKEEAREEEESEEKKEVKKEERKRHKIVDKVCKSAVIDKICKKLDEVGASFFYNLDSERFELDPKRSFYGFSDICRICGNFDLLASDNCSFETDNQGNLTISCISSDGLSGKTEKKCSILKWMRKV